MKDRNTLLCALFMMIAMQASAQIKTYTSLSGFYDYQTNNTCQFIRVNPANGKVHVIFMVADDSANVSVSRRTAYAFSSNEGGNWNNFSQVRVPARRSGYPSLDLLRGPHAGLPVIVNHSSGTSYLQSIPFVDSPEGSGAFTELSPPPLIQSGTDEPVWPDVAGVSDGSLALAGARSVACRLYITLTGNLQTYSPWEGPLQYDCTGRYILEASDSGRIGLLYTAPNSLRLYESIAGSLTWRDTLLIPLPIVIGSDTFALWGSIDFVYLNNELLVVMALRKINRPPSNDGAVIGFWSRATGVVIAIPRTTVQGIVDSLNRVQSGHLSMGFPVSTLSSVSRRSCRTRRHTGSITAMCFGHFQSMAGDTGFIL